MDYSINRFIGYLNQYSGLSHRNRYYVELSFPASINNPDLEGLNLICTSVSMPGHAILTAEKVALRNPVPVPYSFVTEEVEFIFLLDGEYKAMQAFNAWSEKIINTKTHEVAYKNDIRAGKWTIWQLNKKNEKIAGTVIHNVFLKQIGKVDFSDAAHNEVQTLPIIVVHDRRESIMP